MASDSFMAVRLSALLVVLSCGAQAMICGVKTIEGLLAESDVIVVGRVAWVGPTIDDAVVELLLDPSDVVLGPVRPGLLSMRYQTAGFDGAVEFVRGELEGRRVLVFLERGSDSGPMRVISSVYCSSPYGRPAEDFFVYQKVYEEILLPPTSNDNLATRPAPSSACPELSTSAISSALKRLI